MSDYTATLADGRAIFIPSWSAKVQFENLTKACKILGQDEVITISALSVPAAMLAVMGSEDSTDCTGMVMFFSQQARIAGEKVILKDGGMELMLGGEEMDMSLIIEVFTHVMHSQYNDFFESGLAKVASQSK